VHEPSILIELLLLIALATLGLAVFERLGLPSIVGFLTIGALVGPGGFGLVPERESVRSLAELGVVFLLFEIGLELPLDRVRRLWRQALMAGGLQVLVTLAAATASAMALGLGWRQSLVMGGLVAMSSTALVIGILSERGEVDAPHGQLAVGILLFQDLCIVPFLLMVPILAAPDAADLGPVLLGLGGSVVALGAFYFAARLVLPQLLERAARSRSRDLFTLLAVLVVLGSAVLAEEIGLTLAVGAFIGGLALSASPYAHQLFAEVLPLRGVLLGLFFTAVGMLLDVGEAARHWDAVVAYVGGVVLLKAVVVIVIVGLVLRQGVRVGVLTGLALAQTGEFSFVLAAAATQAEILDPALRQTFIAGSVVTLFATPFLVQVSPHLAGWLAGVAPSGGASDAEDVLEGHVVIVGFGIVGRNLARVLRARDVRYSAVDTNSESVREAMGRGEPVIFGDSTRRAVLERVGVERARLVVVAITDPIATRETVRLVRRLSPDTSIVVRSRYLMEVDRLEEAGASSVVAEEYESTLEVIAETLRNFGVADSSIGRFTAGLREEGYELLRAPAAMILDPWLAELIEEVATEWIEVPDMLHGEPTLAALGVRARTGVNVLAVERGGLTTTNPHASFAICRGDRLLVMASPEQLLRLNQLLAENDLDQ